MYHHRVCCPRTRRLHLPSGLSQDRDRPQLGHQAHRSLVVGRDSPVADALRAAGSDHGDLGADVPEAGREKCCGSDRRSAGTGLAAAHRSRAGEAAHMGHAKAEDRGSVLAGRDYGVPDHTGRAAVVHTPPGLEEGSLDYGLHSHAAAVAAAGMRRRGCSRSLDHGLGPDRSNPVRTCRS